MNPVIKEAILAGRVVLLLGAGASKTSKSRDDRELLDSWGLAKLLAQEAGMEYCDEPLAVVYAATKKPLGPRLNQILERLFKHTRPSSEYEILSRYPWARIYTLNIDDALDKALKTNSPQNVNLRNRFDKIVDRNPFFDELDCVKLNGNVDRLQDGLVFSPQEYGAASATPPLWYEELAKDYFRYTFLFIGTKLSEPLFYHQVERFRPAAQSSEGQSYVITPNASEIEKGGLRELNIDHVAGTLNDFAQWLKRELPQVPTPLDLAKRHHPQIEFLITKSDRSSYLNLFEKVIRVSQVDLSAHLNQAPPPHRVRDFYRGFKPTWQEVLQKVPAKLRTTSVLEELVLVNRAHDRLIVLYGPAGSGKTTALMQVALEVSSISKAPVYFLSEATRNIRELVGALEESNKSPYYLFIDRIAPLTESLLDVLKSGRLVKGTIVGTERQNVWTSRTQAVFQDFTSSTVKADLIDEKDAIQILAKLEEFGPWHRLSKLSPEERRSEILKKSHRQLLVGLLEATAGQGFDEIITKDYHDIENNDARAFLVLIGLATIHQLGMPEAIAARALRHLNVVIGVPKLLELTAGIVRRTGDSLIARHPVYIERLFEIAIDKEEKARAIHALLDSFAAYGRPLMKSVGRGAGRLFKLTVNHNYLKNVLHGDRELVLNVFESFSKAFQDDGQFWLQFGLALRDCEMNPEALEKLRIARETHPLRQADHAYAQQLLIIAAIPATPPALAKAYLDEAKEILEKLDAEAGRLDGVESDYPIVTLSEQHTTIILRLYGDVEARKIASYYANIVTQRLKDNPHNTRLKQAWKSLTTFATGGLWN